MQELTAQPSEQDEAKAIEARLVILDALGQTLSAKRRDVVAARAACGIESEWTGDEEFYQGYDDANRHEFVNTVSKPTANGQSSEPAVRSKGSVVFPNITQPLVDAVSARIGDVLLPTDDRNFAIEATEIPDMLEGPEPLPIPPAPPVQPGPPGAPPAPPAEPVDPKAQAQAELKRYKAEADRKAAKAQSRIDDWLEECQYHAELRKVFDDVGKLGSGVIKGPVPVKRKSTVWQQGEDGVSALVLVEEIKPASMRIDPWNLYPDYPACGESIHNGSFIWEYDQISERKLQDLKGLPGYLDSQIDKCIAEGPSGGSDAATRMDVQARSSKTLYDIWYFHGNITAEQMEASGCDCGDEKKDFYPAKLTLVNDRVINAALNPLDNGEFPYDLVPWKRRPGMPWGMGLARQIRTPQRIVVGATRRLADNAGLASGPQIVVRRGVSPQNGVWEIEPLKIWEEDDDAAGNASAPVSAVVIPMMLTELTNLIQLGMKMAEDVTGMPALMQGQQGSAPDTVGGMQILNNNANSVLRRIARMFDACITEPHIRRYYAWLMQYGEDPEEKGDFNIVARGSTALVERDIQSQEMIAVLQLCLNPSYGKDPERAMDEYLKSRRFDPAAFDYSDEKKAKMAAQPQMPPPPVMVAQMREQGATERKQMELKAAEDKLMAEAQFEKARQDFEAREAEKDRQLEAMMKEVDAQLKREDLSSTERVALEREKVLLANVALRLKVQERMANNSRMSAQVTTPAVEPAGRAAPGQAFVQ
jgi:hypothetical protein